MKTNFKVNQAFDKLVKKFVVCPTSHDLDFIKRAMQDIYDLGHADGFAEGILNNIDKERS